MEWKIVCLGVGWLLIMFQDLGDMYVVIKVSILSLLFFCRFSRIIMLRMQSVCCSTEVKHLDYLDFGMA